MGNGVKPRENVLAAFEDLLLVTAYGVAGGIFGVCLRMHRRLPAIIAAIEFFLHDVPHRVAAGPGLAQQQLAGHNGGHDGHSRKSSHR
jgi:hypothetical protein